MLESPSMIHVEARAAAIIRIEVPRPDMAKVMGPAIQELKEAFRAQGITPAGPLFAHHLRMDDAIFNFEIGYPTDHPLVAAGRVQPGQLPAGNIVRATYHGGYEGLSAAWASFRRWIEENKYERTPDLWEVYVAGPELSQNPADWRTELNQPVRVATKPESD